MTAGEKVDQINLLCDKWVKVVQDVIVFGLQGEPLDLRMRLLERSTLEIRSAQKKCIAEAVKV